MNEEKLRYFLKRVTAELHDARRRLKKAESPDEPVAVVGMGCRYPGGVRTPEDLWELVWSAGDAISGFPAGRGWDEGSLAHEQCVRQGGFLHAAGDFDPGFFGISPREASAMDPQQRLLLEVSWEALEQAGIDPTTLRGSLTGMFAGVEAQEYGPRLGEAAEDTQGHLVTGNASSVASGRVAYVLGLEGPAVSVDTACSSSLVALHLACQALRAGECTMALAGGVTVMATPGVIVELDRQGGLSPDGRCRAFGAGADGFGLAEGIGVLAVERLSDARRNGHRVLALIRGSAVNQDGASNGLTAPNGPSQQRVIRAALANAGLSPGDVDAVEAHGTGTRLGDPIEADALLATYGADRPAGQPLWLGSVKSNIGHSQAAAGVAGVIKMVMALRHEVLPRTLHADEPSPHVDWSAGSVRLLTSEVPWMRNGHPRRAGVSSFGISGTNAHIIVEEPPEEDYAAERGVPGETSDVGVPGGVTPWVVSGRGGAALRGQAGRLAGWVRGGGLRDASAADAGYALATGRAVLEDRAVVLAGDADGFAGELAALAKGEPSGNVVTGTAGAAGGGKVAFVFAGQGGQWAEMAVGLAGACPVFAERLGECVAALEPYVDWPVAQVLAGEGGADVLDRPEVLHPVLWAVMVSLAAVWEWLGVVPAAVAGHSQGEIAAACVAGALSLEDGARVVALRAKALGRLSGRGTMLTVGWGAEVARQRLAGLGVAGEAVVAAVNSPRQVTLSGPRRVLGVVAAMAREEGVVTRWLPVDLASHWAQVEEIRDELDQALAGIRPRPGRVPFYSAVTGGVADGGGLDGGYWFANVREPVRFAEVVRSLADAGHSVFVEISPHPLLLPVIEETLEDAGVEAVVAGSLRVGEGGLARMLVSAAELFVRGVAVDWAAVFPGQRRFVELPTYAFQRQRYWLRPSARASRELAALDRLRYRMVWQPVADPDPGLLDGWWLLVVPSGMTGTGLAAGCARMLADGGAEVRTVEVDLSALDRAALAARLGEGAEVAGVVSLLGLGGGGAGWAGVAGTLVLVQALGDAGIGARLWVLTSGAVAAAEGECPDPVQAAVWGLGRAAALEVPRRWGGLIDVPAELAGRAAARVRALLASPKGDGQAGAPGEDQVAVREAGLLACRLVRAPAQGAERSWRPPGVVLVTGGTGALGGHMARWVAERGTAHVVLASRRGAAAPGAARLAAQVSALGAGVMIVTCDVAERGAVAALLDRLATGGVRVSMVVHTAGTVQFTPLEQVSVADIARVWAGKATGAANLDELTGEELDGFVLFSSGAGAWGSGGQTAYAAANAYLDALAERRRAQGRAGTSVAWGLWAEGGMSAGSEDMMTRQGIREMAPARAVAVLAGLLADGLASAVVVDMDWERFAPTFTIARPSPLIMGIAEARQAIEAAAGPRPDDAGGQGLLAGQLAGRSAAEQEHVLLEVVRAEAAAVLGHASAEAVTAGAVFRDLGFDSVTAVDFRNKLAGTTGLRLPATLVFDYPTPMVLARWLRGEVTGSQAAVPVQVARAGGPDEPLAIVGMGCRFPGGAGTPDELWELVRSGTDAIGGFPVDRGWDDAGLRDAGAAEPGYARAGGFVYEAGEFDPAFFGISPREALVMDPQQRLLLEVSWEAIERAGIDPATLRGTPTGVFTGVAVGDYGSRLGEGATDTEGYLLTGTTGSVVSGRVAYVLGLEGPAVSVDTACSSSLVALHLACQALRSGDCTMALAGGVRVMATPVVFSEFSRQGGLSSDGRCKAFGAGADGTGWGEGAGVLVLERLSDAQCSGHRVLAVVRGSAINQDGASNGLTAPNGPSQQRVIIQALASAGLTTGDVDAVEAHGTGTVLGDPIEAQALLATYGRERPADRPLWLGSVKSNIGHTQAAAGVAGVIKMVLALRHETLPPTLHADEPSPHVDWSAGAVRLLTGPVPWLGDDGRPRRAGVSAFGVSGTNVHVILEEGPAADVAAGEGGPAGKPPLLGPAVLPWVVSGRSAAGLAAQAGQLAAWITERPDVDLADVGFSLITTRSVFEHRAVVTGTGQGELTGGLAAVAAGRPVPGVVTGVASDPRRVVFVFPGQGGQWAGMGQELAGCCPVFAERLAECGRALAPWVDWDLDQVLAGAADAPRLERADVVQPALWAVMVALAATWQAAGVVPDAVVGHSQGEIAAATVAGILTVDQAARVVAVRSRALTALTGGGMLSVAEPAGQVRQRLDGYGDRLVVAAVNGPAATVVSGEAAALAELAEACEVDGVRVRSVPVDYASHCAQVEAVREEILAGLAGLAPAQGQVPMVSAVTGETLAGDQADAGYWFKSLREPVQFEQAVRTLAASEHAVFIEVSPHPVLTTAITGTLEDAGGNADTAGPVVAGTLRRDDGGPGRFLASLAEVYVRGTRVDWAAVLGHGRRVELPTYAFQRERYWPQPSAVAGDVTAAGLGAVRHPLLGAAVELAGGGGLVLTGRVSLRAQPWLADHAVAGVALFPAAAFVELAVRAGDAARCGQVEELTLQAPLALPADGAVQVQVTVGLPNESGQRPVELHARPDGSGADGTWTRHASGLLAPDAEPDAGLAAGFAAWPPPGAVPVDTAGFYENLAAAGYGYGPAFQLLRAAWRDGEDVLAEVAMPEEVAPGAASFGLHPALLDAALQASALAAGAGFTAPADGSFRMPFAWAGVSVYAAGASALRVRLSPQPGGGLSLAAVDSAGMPVVSVRSLVLRPVPAGVLTAGNGMREALFAEQWALVPVAGDVVPGRWAVAGGGAARLAAGLAAAGVDVRAYPDLAVLAEAAGAGEPVPEVVLACAGAGWNGPAGDGVPGYGAGDAAGAAGRVLGLVQQWLAAEGLGSSRLVVLTRGAVACGPGEGVSDLPGAAVWGLVRAAQSENPGRLMLADLPVAGSASSAVLRVLVAAGTGEPELAVRDEGVYARRLGRPGGGLVPPGDGRPWRLEITEPGRLDSLALVECPQAAAPLEAGQVRVAVRAGGLGFRDVLVGLGTHRDAGALGREIAGVVAETGPGVAGLVPGDRVMGLAMGGFGPVAVADARLLVPVPPGWSFAAAAAVPMAYVTAWHALALAGAQAGQRVAVHAAAGGVGMATVAVARHLGLEVYGTASREKWDVLAGMGLDAGHVASSRTAGFAQAFLAATSGAGMDIVLSPLAGDLAEASLGLLPRGGVFVDISTTGIRDPAVVARDHPGVSYQAFDLDEVEPERLGRMLTQVAGLLAAEELPRLPVRAWDVRRAAEAFRFMAAARHTGKIVLAIPPDVAAPRPPGTVLVTGGTGALGGLVAGHLADAGRARDVVLASRSGPAAAGAAALAARVAGRGARAQVVACDVADRAALAGLLAQLPAASPLTAVVHAAGVLEDGVIGSLTPGRVDAVLRPKADAAWHLHELTADLDLEAFILFSSAAAIFGGAGQGSYTAGNAFLDGLAAHRRAAGLPAMSLAWGAWVYRTGIGRNLGENSLARISRSGITDLTAEEGLVLLDLAMSRDEPTLIPARLDLAGIRARAAQGAEMPPLWRELIGPVRPAASAAAAPASAQALRAQLAGLPPAGQLRVLTDLVRAHAAAVLGHASPEALEPGQAFKDVGFDSLTAVELRNRLGMSTGLQLPATLVFDYPTSARLSCYLSELLSPAARGDLDSDSEEDEIRRLLASIPIARLRDAGVLKTLSRLSGQLSGPEPAGPGSDEEDEDLINAMDAAALVRMANDTADI